MANVYDDVSDMDEKGGEKSEQADRCGRIMEWEGSYDDVQYAIVSAWTSFAPGRGNIQDRATNNVGLDPERGPHPCRRMVMNPSTPTTYGPRHAYQRRRSPIVFRPPPRRRLLPPSLQLLVLRLPYLNSDHLFCDHPRPGLPVLRGISPWLCSPHLRLQISLNVLKPLPMTDQSPESGRMK